MQKKTISFSSKKTTFYFDAQFAYLDKLVSKEQAVIITDEHVFNAHRKVNWLEHDCIKTRRTI